MLLNPILQQIFSHLSLPDRLRASRVCRKWYMSCNDPYLYQHIVLEDLEFNVLLQAMEYITMIRPRIKSITIKGCYSEFIQNTIVPVQFIQQHAKQPLLFSPIRVLQPARRRQEYQSRGFELHNHFSDLFSQFLELGQSTLHSIKIVDCDLDFEMTELFCSIACHAQTLETFCYMNNNDKGLASSGLLQAIVSGSPCMRHFQGTHAGMNDTVLMTMARHWPLLESITLSSPKSKDWVSDNELDLVHDTSPTLAISNRAFWELLCKCSHLRILELHDLACMTNHDLALYLSYRDALRDQKRTRYSSYDTPLMKRHYYKPSHTPANTSLPGASLKELRIYKYITTPLSMPGFYDTLRLFPNLEYFEYATNFHTFNNQFQGVTPDMFEAEQEAVARFMATQNSLNYVDQWNQPITREQRLIAGMTVRSDQH